jgi:hypothetical protein
VDSAGIKLKHKETRSDSGGASGSIAFLGGFRHLGTLRTLTRNWSARGSNGATNTCFDIEEYDRRWNGRAFSASSVGRAWMKLMMNRTPPLDDGILSPQEQVLINPQRGSTSSTFVREQNPYRS